MLKPLFSLFEYGWHKLAPASCLWCRLPVEQYNKRLCQYCTEALPALPFSLCHYNLLWLPAIAGGLPKVAFDQLLSLSFYQQPWQHWIQRWKFHHDLVAGTLLTEQFCQLLQSYQQSNALLPQALVYVPMHPAKQRQRGFNQAKWLAQAAGKQLSLPVLDILTRSHYEVAQVGLNRQQRQKNLKHAFAIDAGSILPAHIALVDDVVTTGATANQLCRLLRKHGVQRISLWTLAVTPH